MTGYVRIFEHPYYAVTDENGNFEIKNAPVGKFRIVYEITIKSPATEMKPVDFDVSPKKN
jgi:hypothetical protein